MLRYFFNVPDYTDEIGMMLPDDHAARRYAMDYTSDLLREMEIGSRGQEYWRMDVRLEGGCLAFSLVVELLPAARSASAVLRSADDADADDRGAPFKRYGS